MELKTYRKPFVPSFEYATADMPENNKYRPGFVNEVKLYHEFEQWLVYYTDGYKEQFLNAFVDRDDALAAMESALANGAGGSFTSFFRPNSAVSP